MTKKLQVWLCITMLFNAMPTFIIIFRASHPPDEPMPPSLLFVSEQMDPTTYSSAMFSIVCIVGALVILYQNKKMGLWIICCAAFFILTINFVTFSGKNSGMSPTGIATFHFSYDRGVSALLDGVLFPAVTAILMKMHWKEFE